MEKQVDKEAYAFEKYGQIDRFSSYFYQLREVLTRKPSTILEIGVGDRVFCNYIESNTQIAYSSLDIADDLSPTIVGDIRHMPVADGTFDIVCAFEVLEHLPFEEFEKSIIEMKRVAKDYVILSVPHFGPPIKFLLKLPFLPEFRFAWKVPFLKAHTFNGQHYWELGKRGYAPKTIREILRTHFALEKEFIPFENQYHHFFVLKK